MKKKVVLFVLVFSVFCAFAEDRVISRSKLIEYMEWAKTATPISPDDMYAVYNYNGLQFEKQFSGIIFLIRGRITRIRRGVFNEYIVELECSKNWLSDISVVYPERISEAMKNKLVNLSPGEYYQALVVGRSSWRHVDVPVWNQNGVYRTEP